MPIKKSELYSSLWQSCDELRGGMDASQYKDYVLVLLFIKYVSDKYAGQPYAPITIPPGAGFKDTIVAKSKTNELEYRYRRYCFQTNAVKAQFRFFAVGTKVSGISKTNIARIALPVPSVPEQTAIAAILSDMDAEIAALEEELAKARQLKQGMMQELLTGRIRLPVDGAKTTE